MSEAIGTFRCGHLRIPENTMQWKDGTRCAHCEYDRWKRDVASGANLERVRRRRARLREQGALA